ncbi:MAG: ABC transporter permease subunit [Clostridia bacterium]|nr:ABC transporter permease subunit [Clostridia bacterium]
MHNKMEIINRSEKKMYIIFGAVIIALWSVSTFITDFSIGELFANSELFWQFLTEDFFPPKLPKGSELVNILKSVATTLAMAVSATATAGIFAFFVSLFGSEYISPFPTFAKAVRGFATFIRNIPALVWAFILFSSLGIGIGVGFFALFITSFGFMVRAFVETMDEVSKDCVESLLTVGATFPERVINGILPSCINGFISWFLYCFEVNIRASTIVGMVGGGGIGLVLFSYLKSFKYHTSFGIILIIALMVIAVDMFTNRLRREMSE